MQSKTYPATAESNGYVVHSEAAVASPLMSYVDRAVELIEHASRLAVPTGATFTSDAGTLNIKRDALAEHKAVQHEWRFIARKLAMLSRFQEGWDYAHSQPLQAGAQANYLEWLATVSPDRMGDAEPMLTDEGHIRLEWRQNGYTSIAEIGADSLYLAVLAPVRSDDDAEEYESFEQDALDRFFRNGILRS
ncbi:hypothetical protein MMAN_04390 [Mycobacterium mantenii]|uniref:Uncharacterized protein n=2 Tax=Mycobacterium mantenii TaxID=560555 RepID=A0ABM7JLI5_MYCNT|nr:hypothetical protein MMAN_04390 [Mycobacterium mantenii]